jgi:lambda repressor-like predicted transcriptional regulator
MVSETTIKIRVMMMRKGLTGAAIARSMGVTRATVNETIRLHWKSPRTRKAIADALQVPYEKLWGEKPRKAA